MGGVVILILTKGVGERLTYGIPARYRVILVERLGGLFFDGSRVSRGEYTCLCVRLGRWALYRSMFLLVTAAYLS